MSDLSDFNKFFHHTQESNDDENDLMNKPSSVHQICPDKYSVSWKNQLKVDEKTPLIKKLASVLQQNSSTADVTIRIGDEEFNTSLLVLQCYSKYFQEISSISLKTIELPSSQISVDVFHKIGDWIIDNEKIIKRSDLMLMLRGAQFLKIHHLENQILHIIQDAKKFQENEALMLYLEANFLGCEQVKNLMITRVQKFFLTFVSCEEFVHLNENEIEKWLKLDTIALNNEIEAFYAVCRWMLYDWYSRKSSLRKLMKCMRFGLVEPWRIVELRMNKNQGKLKEILNDPKLQELLEQSLSYSTYKSCFPEENSEQFYDFISRFGFYELLPRTSMMDPEYLKNFKETPYTFADFENYLDIIRLNACENWKHNTIFDKEPETEFIMKIVNY